MTRGQVNYEGFHEASGGLFVAWSALGADDQARWETGARRVEELINEDPREV